MDINNFGFFLEKISGAEMTWDMQVDFMLKCYNLFLLYFYFEIMKFVIGIVQRIVRRASKFDH